MNKPSNLIAPGDPNFGPGWADAETRAFFGRPNVSPPFGKVLRAIVISAMAVAAMKFAWLLVIHL